MFFDQPIPQPSRVYSDDEGNLYIDDEQNIAGIGSFFKKIGKFALPIAGVALNAIPGIGTAASIAINAGLSAGDGLLNKQGKAKQDVATPAGEISQKLDEIAEAYRSGEANWADTINGANQIVQAYQNSTDTIKDKKTRAASVTLRNQLWDKVRQLEKIVPVVKPPVQSAPASGGNIVTLPDGQQVQQVVAPNGQIVYQPVQSGGGFDTGTLAIVGVAALGLILVLKK